MGVAAAGSARVFMHPTALLPRSAAMEVARRHRHAEDAGLLCNTAAAWKRRRSRLKFFLVYARPGLSHENTVEDTGGPIFLDAAGAQPIG